MNEILLSIIAFIISVGLLITFHEFGHFSVARFFDIKVLRFSIGFGRPIYTRHFGRDRTEFTICLLPLGGYVKMLDDREGTVVQQEKAREFNGKPLWQRFLIVLAGPFFNFIFAIIAYSLIYTIGINALKPIIGHVETTSIASSSGFAEGQEILSINGLSTPTWPTVIDSLVNHVVSGDVVDIQVVNNSGEKQVLSLNLSSISIDEMADGKLLNKLGLNIVKLKLPPIIGEIEKNGPAQSSGLLQNDRIIAVNSNLVDSWQEWVEIIQENPDKSLNVELLRDEALINIELRPKNYEINGKNIGRIGARPAVNDDLYSSYFALEQYSLHLAILRAFDKTWEMSVLTLKVLAKMISGDASVKNLSGPISIAKYAGQSASIGATALLTFLAIVSISLGVLNLLPIPLLDGGHLVYYVIEFFTGKPVSDSVQMTGQQIGIVLLFGLMGLALYNDFVRLLG
ncbi:MAG TPA: RIP metalloprotease RseP [Gammaproteobacteria bacterium]|jgi:regulator of sigma E protease|nr:RIP metalloprotease RseP [Gammaproteobacteria bacterium]